MNKKNLMNLFIEVVQKSDVGVINVTDEFAEIQILNNVQNAHMI